MDADRLITSEPTMDQGSVRRGSKYFYHRYLSGFLDRSDPRSKGIDRLITSEPTLDQGSVVVLCR